MCEMKKYPYWILAAALLVLTVACGPANKVEDPAKTDPKEEQTPVPPQEEDGEKIEGTVILPENNGAGFVSDAKTGKGIAGVTVTDGYTCVQTDKNGVYQLNFNNYARFVYVSVPAAYKIPLDEQRHYPQMYKSLPVGKTRLVRNDFVLEPLDKPEKQFTMIMIGDPQCKSSAHVNRYRNETIEDIKATIAAGQKDGRWLRPYAMTLGDIVHDKPNLWSDMRNSMANVKVNDEYLPFFQCIGNHDHNATRTASDYDATTDFVTNFGPADYSFDRGDVHIVVMDNIVATSSSGSTWSYGAGFSDAQYEWLKQDLALVSDKDKRMVFLCCHIPFRNGAASGSGSSVNKDKHYEDVLKLLTDFHEAHIMIGHTHYAQNWIHTDYACKGGQPVYEHIHQAACGAWWSANSSVSGAPNGYNIYEIDGASVVDWVNKGTGRPLDYQLRVYDGNQLYSGTNGYNYNWFLASNIGGEAGISAPGSPLLKNCFIAEVWDDDSRNVTVELWQGGKKRGDFTRLDNGTIANIALTSFWFNEKNKNTATYASKTASHYWFYKPETGVPTDVKDWEVRVTRRIPSSGKTHLYTRDDFTVDYSEF